MDQQIGAYLQAVRKREAARRHFAEMTDVVSEVAKRMAKEQKSAAPGNPRVVHYSGFGMNGGYVDPANWLTADAIARAREDLASSVSRVEDLWQQIPHDQRIGLSPPTAAQGHG